ncbi:MFS transporter [Paraburkholderia caffeinilytica]|uniref:MFS transporter n=1 Tax=Paraburkholderia caffeinilytica TaxID=1761016 RepID=UPI0038BD398F
MNWVQETAIRKAMFRLVPFLIVCYFFAYIDRVNVGFAALTMNKALGLDSAAFGFGAGAFFLTYFVFEVPSNLLLERVGARKWIARIMLTWGVLSGLMAAIPTIAAETGLSTTTVFYALRMALGAAEAGFFPGILYYLMLWFPSVYRARIIGYFMAAVPFSSVIGAPLSGLLMKHMSGVAGLQNWQWLFIIEAVPTLMLSAVVLLYLTDRPSDAGWLSIPEREWLVRRMDAERRRREAIRKFSVWQALGHTRVLLLSCVCFGMAAAISGMAIFLPQIVRNFNLSLTAVGFVTAIPYLLGTVGSVWWGRRSDRLRERKEHVGLGILISGVALAASTAIDDPVAKMIALSLTSFGVCAALPVFWTLPAAFLSGSAAAGGFAIISALGNLGGFVGPYLMGNIKNSTGSFTIALLAIAALVVLAALLALTLPHEEEAETGLDEVHVEPDAARQAASGCATTVAPTAKGSGCIDVATTSKADAA